MVNKLNLISRNIILILLILLSSCKNFSNIDPAKLTIIKDQINNIELPKATSKYIIIFNNAFENIYPTDNINKNYKFNNILVNNNSYQLNIDFNFTSASLLINKNSDLMEENITININYSLTQNNKDPSSAIYKSSFTLQSANDIVDSPYANYIGVENIKTQLIKQAAQDIYQRLVVFFLNQQNIKN